MKMVSKYRLDSIADLARQLGFSPTDTRLDQLSRAEALLHELVPGKAYPVDFIVFRVTGYHPKAVAPELLTGLALQHDLGLLIEEVSATLSVNINSIREPVLDIDQVSERFNVTSKTIQRWRRRGLPARRFVFSDGKLRVGFLLSSVERFFAAHRDQVVRGTNVSQVDDSERDQIIRRATRLAAMCHCSEDEITRRIARRLNRSPVTVLHTIRKFDSENPHLAVFPQAAESISDVDRARILKGHRRGVGIRALARRVGRSRASVYRVIVEERGARITRRKVRFIDDPLYHGENAQLAINDMLGQEPLTPGAAKESVRVPKDLPAYLQDLYRTPLLNPVRERALFLLFNYHKFLFVQARKRLEPSFARARELDELEGHLRRATEAKNAIVQANLRLVVSVARKHLRPNLNLMELVSDGNITLMRAVESFDVHRGNRFSTYGTLALMKGFARSVPAMRCRTLACDDENRTIDVSDATSGRDAQLVEAREQVSHLLSQLSERERAVVCAHFGLPDESGTRLSGQTYEELGRRFKLTKQRVRQIEQVALARLRSLVTA